HNILYISLQIPQFTLNTTKNMRNQSSTPISKSYPKTIFISTFTAHFYMTFGMRCCTPLSHLLFPTKSVGQNIILYPPTNITRYLFLPVYPYECITQHINSKA